MTTRIFLSAAITISTLIGCNEPNQEDKAKKLIPIDDLTLMPPKVQASYVLNKLDSAIKSNDTALTKLFIDEKTGNYVYNSLSLIKRFTDNWNKTTFVVDTSKWTAEMIKGDSYIVYIPIKNDKEVRIFIPLNEFRINFNDNRYPRINIDEMIK